MTTALVIGAGGLGCPVALGLAEGGVERIRLVDPDTVELSNLQRQVLFQSADVGRVKVEAAAEHLRQRCPSVTIEPVVQRVNTASQLEALLADCDVAVDATDDPGAGFLLNDVALALGVPAVLGGVIRFEGVVLAIGPGHGPCYRCLFEDVPGPDEVATCAAAGVLGAMAGVVGHLQVRRALGLLAGATAEHTGFVTTVDALRGRIREVALPLDTDGCLACGSNRRPVARGPLDVSPLRFACSGTG